MLRISSGVDRGLWHYDADKVTGGVHPISSAVAESFFGTLKQELVHRSDFATRTEAKSAIFEYIEVFYNRWHRHSFLGYMSPAEFEAVAVTAALAA